MSKLTIGQVAKQLRKQSNRTLQDVAADMDSDAGNLSRFERGKQDASSDFLEKLATALGTTVAKMYAMTEQEADAPPNTAAPPDNIEIRQVPVLSWVQAGLWTESPEMVPSEYMEMPVKNGRRVYALRVTGDSMIASDGGKSYPPGCYIAVDPDAKPENGSRVIAKKRGTDEAIFKVFVHDESGKFYLNSRNRQYDPILMTEDYMIIGVVVGKWEPE